MSKQVRTTRTARRGISLIELTVVIAASAMLMGLAAVAFTRFLTVRTAGQEHLERTIVTARLAEQFRRDVWSTQTARSDGENRMLLGPESSHIKYQIDGDGIHRTEFAGDKVSRRDAFATRSLVPLRLNVDGNVCSLTLATARSITVETEPAHGRPLTIIALLGRDTRLVQQ